MRFFALDCAKNSESKDTKIGVFCAVFTLKYLILQVLQAISREPMVRKERGFLRWKEHQILSLMASNSKFSAEPMGYR